MHFFLQYSLLQFLFLKDNIRTFTVMDGVQRSNTVCTFQLKSFDHNNVILSQVFLRKINKYAKNKQAGEDGRFAINPL